MRTGVTAIVPHEGEIAVEPLFAGCHALNGCGDFTGLEWIRESGPLTSPIALTNTYSLGAVRDDGFFQAAAEAILNAMLQAETMAGRDSLTAHALDGEQLVQVLDRFGRRSYRPL